MNLIARFRKAVSGIDNPLARVILFGLGRTALWTPADYTALSKAGYENCVTLYACVNYICRAAAGIEWTATLNKKDAPDHAILRLSAHPNDREGRRAFIFRSFASLLISGNRYILAGRIGQQPPLALWCPRADFMQIIPGGSRGQIIDHYEYGKTGDPVKLDPSLVMHSKLFHPTENFYGLSPLSVASHAVDISNMANEWNMRLLQNDMRPPGALSTEGALSPVQFDRLKTMMKTEWQGYENAGQPLLLEGGLKWVNFMLTAKEMDWLNTTKANKRDICTVYNLDPCLVGDSEYATYSNKVEARKGAYEDVIIPLMDEFCDDLNSWLAPMFGDGVVLGINKDKIPALQESREKQYAYLAGSWWLRIDELRKLTGQDPVGGPEGETILVPMGRLALADAIAPAGSLADDTAKSFRPLKSKSLGGFWRGENERKALWQNFERRVTAKERVLVREMQAYLKAQAEGVVAKAGRGTLTAEALLNRAEAEKSYVTRFKSRYMKLFATALVAGRRMTEGKLYDFTEDDKADEPGISDELRRKLEKLIEETARVITDETLSEIQAVLREAIGTNLTVQEIANALKDKLVDQMSPVRARRIARTETGMLENFGNLEGFKENEYVNKKMWVAQPTEFSRDAHLEADGQEVGIDETFKVGGEEMEYPMDRTHGATAGNIINCNCTEAPVVE